VGKTGRLLIAGIFCLLAGVVGVSGHGHATEYRTPAVFSQAVRVDRRASEACAKKRFGTYSSHIVHFSDLSVRVATRRQIHTRLTLTSPIYYLRYEGTRACTVYVPLD